MRPSILFPLFAEIRTLSGVGPKLEKLIAKVAGPRLVDLVFDLPVGIVDRSYRPRLIEAQPGRIATVAVDVLNHLPPRVKSQPYRVRVSDETAVMELVFFRAAADYLMEILPPGSRRIVSGRIESFKDRVFNGRVTRIAPLGVEKDNVTTFSVRVSIDNSNGEIKANMTANAEIINTEHKNALTVPEQAINYDPQKKAFVNVPDAKAKDGMRKVEIAVGISNGSKTEILSGLNAGDKVVLAQ